MPRKLQNTDSVWITESHAVPGIGTVEITYTSTRIDRDGWLRLDHPLPMDSGVTFAYQYFILDHMAALDRGARLLLR